MDTSMHQIGAGEFKSKCLGIMEQVHETGQSVIVTKRGVPMVKIIPLDEMEQTPKPMFGALKDSITINGDILASIEEKWDAEE